MILTCYFLLSVKTSKLYKLRGRPGLNDDEYRIDSLFTLVTVTEFDVRHIKALRGGFDPGFYSILADFLKINLLVFTEPLLHLT